MIFIYLCIEMDKTIKDPKIIAAVIAGFLVPKITSYLGGLLKDAITDRKANKRIYVGV